MKYFFIRIVSSILIIYDKFIGKRILRFFEMVNSNRRGAVFIHKGKNLIIRKDVKVVNPQWIGFGNNTVIGDRVTISAWNMHGDSSNRIRLKIGNNCRIGDGSHLTAANYIEIGDGLLTGKRVLITDNNHGNCTKDELNIDPVHRSIISKGPVIIGRNVWIGENSSILNGVTIGDGVIIGANSVVTKSIPAGGIAVGNPAKLVRTLTL